MIHPVADDELAKIVLAEYALQHHPVLLDPGAPIHIYAPSDLRVAYTMPSLIRLTSKWSIARANRCSASKLRRESKIARYLFRVNCSEGYSKGPHIVRVQVLPGYEGKPMKDRQILVSCSCEFWIFWGPDFNAKTRGYLEGEPRSTGSPAGVRDPGKKNWICKHILAASALFYREPPPEDLTAPPRSKPSQPGQRPLRRTPLMRMRPKDLEEEEAEEPVPEAEE